MPNPDIPTPTESRPLRTSERARLRAVSLCADKTIVRWWNGEEVRAASAERLERAAAETGITRGGFSAR
jgi:hypothetical protein